MLTENTFFHLCVTQFEIRSGPLTTGWTQVKHLFIQQFSSGAIIILDMKWTTKWKRSLY